jgi:nitrite reductase/ring-hydroxylating ferredoxin subunit
MPDPAPPGWYAVAVAADLTAGSVRALGALGRALVAYRAADGSVRIADAACPHQGAHLAGRAAGLIDGDLVCPFHHWRFDAATGRCTGTPAGAVPAVGLRLHPARELAGMVLLWHDPDGRPPRGAPADATAGWCAGSPVRQVTVRSLEAVRAALLQAMPSWTSLRTDGLSLLTVTASADGGALCLRVAATPLGDGRLAVLVQPFHRPGAAALAHGWAARLVAAAAGS